MVVVTENKSMTKDAIKNAHSQKKQFVLVIIAIIIRYISYHNNYV